MINQFNDQFKLQRAALYGDYFNGLGSGLSGFNPGLASSQLGQLSRHVDSISKLERDFDNYIKNCKLNKI